MYVHMYLCIYIYVCMYLCTYLWTYVCMYVCMYVPMYLCMYYVCMYSRMYICTFVCMYVYLCMYVCMYVRVCTYVCIHVCMYACMHPSPTTHQPCKHRQIQSHMNLQLYLSTSRQIITLLFTAIFSATTDDLSLLFKFKLNGLKIISLIKHKLCGCNFLSLKPFANVAHDAVCMKHLRFQ